MKPPSMALLCLCLLPSAACQTAAGSAALVNSALAVSSAAASRANGGCYAACPTGTQCNRETGLCDELPCRGQCPEGSYCDASSRIPHCVRLKPIELKIVRPEDAPPAGGGQREAPAAATGL